jgi:hemolysin activation/secretion protein
MTRSEAAGAIAWRVCFLAVVCLGLVVAATGPVHAQTPAEELAIEGEAAAEPPAAPVAVAAPRAFAVRRIVVGPSAYLPQQDVAQLARAIEARGLSSRDIPQILSAFDALYEARGITLAQATLRRRDAGRGLIAIDFVEARVGVVVPRGTLARPDVYAARIGLRSGDLADTRILEQRLLRLAILSGVRSEVAFTPGAQPGLTDLTVTFDEPPRRSAVFTLDSYGSVATGRFRASFAYADASLTGNLDAFGASLTVTRGLVSGSLSYAFPANADGTAVFATLSAERSRSISGPAVRGRNGLVEIGVSHPLVIEADRQVILRASAFAFADRRDTAGVATTRQSGAGVLFGAGFSREWPTLARLGVDVALRHVSWRDGVLGLSGLSTTYLTAEAAFDTPLGETLALNLRAGAQAVHGVQAPAQFRGSLTGQARVRGYPSGQLAGDAVAWGSAQLRLREPVELGSSVRAVPYAFVDLGRAWDRTGGITTVQGTAVSAGIGASFGIGRNGTADIVIAKPLRDVPGFSAKGAWRLDASLSVRF